MKSIRFMLALCAAFAAARAADITLTDGRTFTDAKVASQTPSHVTLRHSGGFQQVSKKLLPPTLAAQYPLDEAAAAAQKEKDEQARQARIVDAERRQRAAKEKWEKERPEREAYFLGRAEEEKKAEEAAARLKANTRDGLAMVSLRIDMMSAYITFKNVGTSVQRVDYTKIKAKTRSGEIRHCSGLTSSDAKFGQEIEPGQTRTFQAGFGSRRVGDGNWLEEVSWIDGQWERYL